MMTNHSLLPILVLVLYIACPNHVLAQSQTQSQPLLPLRRFEVHITSQVPNTPGPLKIHCQSKDDDLGVHFLNFGQEFYWRFRENFTKTTLFFCRFQWNSKDTSFNVFFRNMVDYCKEPREPWLCFWQVKPDGFYIGDTTLTKLHSW
ncbi:hypothetical protein ACSBR1_031370 [Camellia fascicularis]